MTELQDQLIKSFTYEKVMKIPQIDNLDRAPNYTLVKMTVTNFVKFYNVIKKTVPSFQLLRKSYYTKYLDGLEETGAVVYLVVPYLQLIVQTTVDYEALKEVCSKERLPEWDAETQNVV